MYTTTTLAGNGIFHKHKHPRTTHRAAYKAILKLIGRNQILDGCSELKLKKVEHQEKNHTRFLLLADGRFFFNLYITTYED